MSRIAYVNGQYVSHRDGSVHIEDRGYQFGDGVYEVVLIHGSQIMDCDGHLDRLQRSLAEMDLPMPVSRPCFLMILRRMVALNHIKKGIIYLQVTRGVAKRDHKYPAHTVPALVMTAKHLHFTDVMSEDGVSAITAADERWARRDIKTIQLLANCRAKQKAAEQGAYEAILVMPDGSVSEGSSSNVWMVSAEGELVTREASNDILNGITRQSIAQIASERQMKIVNRSFTVADMLNAKEVFVTSATSLVTPITKIDDTVIANGKMGSLSAALRADYLEKTSRVSANERNA